MELVALVVAKLGYGGVAALWAAKVACFWAGHRLWKRRNSKV
ncbi:hypothetical protein [Pseudooceanicola onchidii]|nr:hypothetical protein [Pseudooceanicola onchidii]